MAKRYSRVEVQQALRLAVYYLGRLDEFMPRCKTYYLDAMDDGLVTLEVPCKTPRMLGRIRMALECGPRHRKGDEWYRKLGALALSAYLEPKEG